MLKFLAGCQPDEAYSVCLSLVFKPLLLWVYFLHVTFVLARHLHNDLNLSYAALGSSHLCTA